VSKSPSFEAAPAPDFLRAGSLLDGPLQKEKVVGVLLELGADPYIGMDS
jgi:hypothetical protein